MSGYEQDISDAEKVNIASEFILNAPPGEFNEVFNDVRVLLNNDDLLKKGASKAFTKYNNDQFTPVQVPGCEHKTLVTKHGEVGANQYVDPRSQQQFSFDHLRKEASGASPSPADSGAEGHRSTLEKAILSYVTDHYPNGVCAVYGSSAGAGTQLTVCIEDHKFNPNNFWNGRWRSEWTVAVSGGSAELKGTLKAQVHYYEDGNVQLISEKSVKDTIGTGSADQLAKEFVKVVSKAENEYQTAISENYNTMSDTTFKALRRQLPITRSKVDWNKILNYKVAGEMQRK